MPWDSWQEGADLATIITAFGVIAVVFVWKQLSMQRRQQEVESDRLERQREEAAYETITTHYMDVMKMFFENPTFTLPLICYGLIDERPPRELTLEERVRDGILFELMFEVTEKAFVLYRAEVMYGGADRGRGDAVSRRMLEFVWKEDDPDSPELSFLSRQWSGWDTWIRHDLGSHVEYWAAWRATESGDTYDNWFRMYMDKARELSDFVETRVATRGDDDFWGRADVLLTSSFPPDALRPISSVRLACPSDAKESEQVGPWFLGLWNRQHFLGLLVFEYLADSRTVYLWYVATSPEYRGLEIGARALAQVDAVLSRLSAASPAVSKPLGILAEVEAPTKGDGPGSDNRRRIAFYERHGYTVLDMEEVSPPFAEGETDPVMYWLMWKPAPGAGERLTQGQAAAMLTETFAGSRLNGEGGGYEAYLTYSLGTWGSPPRLAEDMLAAWQAHVG